jgi:hypothetical protein
MRFIGQFQRAKARGLNTDTERVARSVCVWGEGGGGVRA